MDARVQRRVQRYGWDKAAAFYEQYWAKQLEPAQRRLIELADPSIRRTRSRGGMRHRAGHVSRRGRGW